MPVLEPQIEYQLLQATLNGKARSKAASLIESGKVKEQASWEGPSAAQENSYLENHSWAEYGAWFLGQDKEKPEDTKGRYKYPFSDDFEKVSVNGLRAIRTRSAQSDEAEIFEASGTLLDKAKEKLELRHISTPQLWRVPFHQTQLSAVDVTSGIMSDVSIIQAGEAKGHGILVTKKSLSGAISLLQGKNLPAYITHTNALGDRLTTEIGYFSGFYLDGERIRARNFQAFDSFRKYKKEQYEQLFEMASLLPENFGISLVFEARLFWELDAGEEEEYSGISQRPEDSLFELPSVEMISIQSADFVDNPAANSSLFSNTTKTEPMKTELTTAASDSPERKAAEVADKGESSQPKTVEEAPKKSSRKKKLSAEIEEPAIEQEASQVEELETRLDQRDTMISDLSDQVSALKAQLDTLKALVEGTEEIAEDFADEMPIEKTNAELKSEAVKVILELDPRKTRSAALLEVGKKNPELFNL